MSAASLAPEPPHTVLHTGEVDDRAPATTTRTLTRVQLSSVLLVLSLTAAWVLLHLLVLSSLEQGRAQSHLYDDLRSQLAEGVAPTGAGAQAGAPLALLSLPALGLSDMVVVEGARSAQLQSGPGHVPGSVLPGQSGTSVVAGKALTYGAPFAEIGRLRPGHLVEVVTQQGEFTYTVRAVRREGDPLPTALTTGRGRLTLVSADRGDATGLGALTAESQVFVDAELATGAAPAGQVSAADPAARWMSAGFDTATVAQVVLTVQLLLLVITATAWSWTRWSHAATVLLATPCVLASLWLATSLSSRLLPGLL